MNYSSRLIEEAVHEFSKLPGVGKRTALRYVLHLLKQNDQDVAFFSNTLQKLKTELKYCNVCHTVSDLEQCTICSSHNRDRSLVCVVEDMRDQMAIENTQQYRGVYHVLGGIISPMDGIGPSDLNIDSLLSRLKAGEIKEVIMALSTTMEGETTNFYVYKRLKELPVSVSVIARGIAVGDNIEYADEITLGRSILNRTPYENTLTLK